MASFQGIAILQIEGGDLNGAIDTIRGSSSDPSDRSMEFIGIATRLLKFSPYSN
jgi:hypothetical protein